MLEFWVYKLGKNSNFCKISSLKLILLSPGKQCQQQKGRFNIAYSSKLSVNNQNLPVNITG